MGRADKPGQDAPQNPGHFLARWSRRKHMNAMTDRDTRGVYAGTRSIWTHASSDYAKCLKPSATQDRGVNKHCLMTQCAF